MADAPPPPPPRAPLSLYDNLLDPNDVTPAATISSAPVIYNQAAEETKKSVDPSLRFQPIRRPQVKQAKPKSTFPKTIAKPPPSTEAAPITQPAKSTLADWAATEDDEWRYSVGEKRQRGGRRNKKKKQQVQMETDWDDIYDPSRPTNIDEYLRSNEKIDEVREWKALLYSHRKRRDESDISDEDEYSRPPAPNQFAPPPSYASVPPPPLSPPRATVPQPPDESGDDVFARRMALSQQTQRQPSPLHTDSVTISRPPLRYDQKDHAVEEDGYSPPPALGQGEDADASRSARPGQSGFAQRLMSKYGWTKGSGLGADESGIINPLRAQVEKRRKKADADGGGWAEPAGKGKIIGGKRKDNTSKFGSMSEVIVLKGMLENMPDLHAEIADGLGQEIGEECGEKYGRVERLYIDESTRKVFIKFTDQVSALRAVSELDGRVFNGNTIVPQYYDTNSFDSGNYGL